MDQAPGLRQTLLRVADIERATGFYVDGFGMQVLRRGDDEGARTSSVFLGFGGEDTGSPVELLSDWDRDAPYTHGTGYGHVAVAVENVAEAFARVETMDAGVIQAPGVVTPGGPNCAFVKDPDGYAIELVESRTAASEDTGFDPNNVILGPRDGKRRILHTMLRISDVDAAILFYVGGLGMQLLERIEIDFKGGVTGLFVGFNRDEAGRQLELSCYHAGSEPYTHGTGFAHIAIDIPDLAATLARLDALGVAWNGDATRAQVRDPDGHPFELIQAGGN